LASRRAGPLHSASGDAVLQRLWTQHFPITATAFDRTIGASGCSAGTAVIAEGYSWWLISIWRNFSIELNHDKTDGTDRQAKTTAVETHPDVLNAG